MRLPERLLCVLSPKQLLCACFLGFRLHADLHHLLCGKILKSKAARTRRATVQAEVNPHFCKITCMSSLLGSPLPRDLCPSSLSCLQLQWSPVVTLLQALGGCSFALGLCASCKELTTTLRRKDSSKHRASHQAFPFSLRS